MLRNSFFLVAALAAGVFGLGTVGCGDDGSSGTGGGGTGGGDASGNTGAGAGDVELTKPPTRPQGAGPGDGAGSTTLGVSALFLGDTDRNGTTSPSAWQSFGYDIDGVATVDVDGDGKITGADLEGRNCAPVQSEANAKNLEDGPGGVDNSFGRNIVSFINSVLENPSAEATAAIEEGSFTIALEMEGLGTGAEYDPIPTSLYAAVGGEDGTWEVVPELLDANGEPLIRFANAYVVDNTWVSGEPQTITLNLSIAGVDLSLNINNAVIAVKLNADRTVGSEGVIAGVLETQALVTEIGEVASVLAGDSNEGLCPGDTLFESVMQTIRNASDIMKDGSQNPGATCDGISIAIGFDAAPVVLGDVAEPSTPEPSSCPPQE